MSNKIEFKMVREKTIRVRPEDSDTAIRIAKQFGYTVTAIDDKDVMGFCESCGVPVLDGEKYVIDPEGIILCSVCMKGEK